MKKIIFFLLFLTPLVVSSQEGQKYLLNVSELKIKPGHDDQFTEAVKEYKACYQENQGTGTWNIWKRLHGDGNVYVLTSTMENWAELDEDQKEAADKQCRNIIKESIWPHIESSSYSIAESMPKISRSPGGDMPVVWVTFFDVKYTAEFREVINEVSTAMREDQGEPRGIWYSFMGGAADAPNYMVSVPYKNFAALDMEEDGPWEIMEKKHGKAKMEEMRNKFRNSVSNIWSYLYHYKEDLSMR